MTKNELIVMLCFALSPLSICHADDTSCEVLLRNTKACSDFASYRECQSIVVASPECKGIEGVATAVCANAIGHQMQRYFECKETPIKSDACKEVLEAVDKNSKALNEAVGCKL